MARPRQISPQFFRHRGLYDAEAQSGLPLRVCYAALWCVADREGRFRWVSTELKLDCLPYDPVDMDAVLAELLEGGWIRHYVVDGRLYGDIPRFKAYQRPHPREAPSRLPAHPDSHWSVTSPEETPKKDQNVSRTHLDGSPDEIPKKDRNVSRSRLEGLPKASLGPALGEPRASLGHALPVKSDTTITSEEGLPKDSPGLAQGSPKAVQGAVAPPQALQDLTGPSGPSSLQDVVVVTARLPVPSPDLTNPTTTMATTTTTAEAEESLPDPFAILMVFPEVYRASIAGLLRASRNPNALTAELRMILSGGRGSITDPAQLGQALHEIAVAGAPPTARAIQRFLAGNTPPHPGGRDEWEAAAATVAARLADRTQAKR